MNFNNGILSITDHKGRYMGMQDIASQFLTGRCIDISTQGPDDNPTAVVLTVYAEEDRGKNLDEINFSATKGDYNENATPQGFLVFLKNATTNFDADKLFNEGRVYRVYNNNGLNNSISLETFNNPNINFTTRNFEVID